VNAADLAKLKARFPISESTARLNSPDGVASRAEPEPPVSHEPVAAQKRKGAYAERCLVRVTSFRLRLADERNLAEKYFVDSLVYAGILHSDSPKHAKVEVTQIQVSDPATERTEIVITPIEPPQSKE